MWRKVALPVAMVCAMGAAACGHSAPGQPHSTRQTIDVAEDACGTGWKNPRPGPQTISFRNTGGNPTTAVLMDAATGSVYAEVDNIASNTTRDTVVNLGGGRFVVRCGMEGSDNPMILGPAVTITGPPGGPAVQPVTAGDLYGPDKQYVEYVSAGLTGLAADTDALRRDVDAGDLDSARTAWLTAHLDYERLGAAYDAFGDYDAKIDGNANGLPAKANDSDFSGFHRVESGLWHGESAAALAPIADRLDDDVHGLVTDFPRIQVPILDLGLRTHEVLENTLQFELTGDDDYGSGSGLATADANVAGTRELLTVLRPVLRSRYPGLPQVDTWLDRFDALVDTHHTAAGWTPVTQLSAADREQLNGTLGQLLQYLAPIATICTPRKTFQ
ncbi:EfeM/EfeO family lipoprotein [Nocardia alni]|uniref:EfeM/EfeO family lipoprotein n=1 Tax=Nocardia alni TaxID=2815723 RepID=UPI001C24ACDC|nr:EfeM/EfeO family lipoprotein [Nocardia alni]